MSDTQKPMYFFLKTEYYNAFKNGTKGTEYRRYSNLYNENTCTKGRKVILSKGYGKKDRLSGTIIGFEIWELGNFLGYATELYTSLKGIYTDASNKTNIACIIIRLDEV